MERSPVDRVLSQRAERPDRRRRLASWASAILLHALVALVVLVAPRLGASDPEFPEYVAVQVVPAAALERPSGQARRPTPEPAAPEPEPEPEVIEAEPEPEPEPDPEIPVLPEPEPERPEPPPERPEPRPQPRQEPPRQETPREEAPPPREAPPAEEQTGTSPGGVVGGDPTSSRRLGARAIGAGGTQFPYGYYLDQILTRVEEQWTRPPVEGIEATLTFRILRNGQVEDIQVSRTSGSRAFDLAALRAVRNASLPPLPAAYRQPYLEVTLIVR